MRLGQRRRREARGIVDNDWIELFNVNGALTARVVGQRVRPGMVMMYHAQEKIVNTPGSEMNGVRGGIHNSVTRIVVKPTHMIGGYAQQLRLQLLRNDRHQPRRVHPAAQDEQDRLARHAGGRRADPPDARAGRGCMSAARPLRRRSLPLGGTARSAKGQYEGARRSESIEPRQVHRLPHVLGDLQERLDQPARHGARVVQQRRDQARNRLSEGMGEPGQVERRLGAPRRRFDRAAPGRQVAAADEDLRQPNLPEIDDYYEPFTFDYGHLQSAPEMRATPTARPRSLISGQQMDKIVWGPNGEEILGGEFSKRSKDKNFEAGFEQMQKDMLGQFENTFMMYLPRLCEHCLNPSCVASCPSGSIYKREEDGIVLIDQDKCRGWRMCVSGCPYKKIYYNWKSGKAEKCIFCYPRIEAGQPTVCRDLRRPHPLSGRAAVRRRPHSGAASVEHDATCIRRSLMSFSIRTTRR